MIDPFDGSDSHSPPPGRDATHPPGRISVLGLMFAVALVGLVLGAFRIHFSLGSFVAGAIGIAVVRTHRKLGPVEPGCEAAQGRAWLAMFVRSLGVAASLLCLAIVPCFLLVLMLLPIQSHVPAAETVVTTVLISSLLG